MSGFAEELAGYDEDFKQVVPAANTGRVIFTDGKHQAIITEALVTRGQYGLEWELKFQGLDSRTNRPASAKKWTALPPEEGREEYLAADLELLGYNYKERGMSGIPGACVAEEFIGIVCVLGVKTKSGPERDYTNIYLNGNLGKADVNTFPGVVSGGEGGDDGGSYDAGSFGGGDAVEEDDIPF